jgi:hypothetical protein
MIYVEVFLSLYEFTDASQAASSRGLFILNHGSVVLSRISVDPHRARKLIMEFQILYIFLTPTGSLRTRRSPQLSDSLSARKIDYAARIRFLTLCRTYFLDSESTELPPSEFPRCN